MSPHLWPQDDWVFDYARACSRAQTYCFLSQENLALARLQLAEPLSNAKIVRYPFNVSYDARPSWPCQEVWKLACVARLFPAQKGQDLLFQVLRMRKWRERSLQVTLYGKGAQEKSLRALREMWKLDRVEFGGFVSDIESVWAAHHGLVLPSRAEGLPLSLVEAMLCGRPAIVTDIGGNGELVEEGVSGFVAGAATVEELDAALERAWERRQDWCEMGQAAAARVRELVPRDPAEVFAAELLSWTGK
jgi:glycosyltransferase involved in cell wall biosynthesis